MEFSQPLTHPPNELILYQNPEAPVSYHWIAVIKIFPQAQSKHKKGHLEFQSEMCALLSPEVFAEFYIHQGSLKKFYEILHI